MLHPWFESLGARKVDAGIFFLLVSVSHIINNKYIHKEKKTSKILKTYSAQGIGLEERQVISLV